MLGPGDEGAADLRLVGRQRTPCKELPKAAYILWLRLLQKGQGAEGRGQRAGGRGRRGAAGRS